MSALLAALPILALLLATAAIAGIRLWRPSFSYSWLIAAGSSLIAFVLVIALSSQIPATIQLVNWQPRVLLPISPTLLLDGVSWLFLVALSAVNLAAFLTGAARPAQNGRAGGEWNEHISSLLLTAFAMLAVLVGNILSLLLLWVLLDLVEASLWLIHARTSRESESVIVLLAVRLLAISLVTYAAVYAYAEGQPLSFAALSPRLAPFLLLASGIRLGVIPMRPALPRDIAMPAGQRAVMLLAPAAASLVILVRAASPALPVIPGTLMLALAALAAVLNGLLWLTVKSLRAGTIAWVTTLSALALAAALRGQPAGSLAWGIALLLGGGLLSLATTRSRRLGYLLLVGALCVSTLPFLPTWQGARLYSLPFHPLLPFFLIGQALLMAGFIRQSLKVIPQPPQAERWVRIIYPLGLALLLVVFGLVSWWPGYGLNVVPANRPAWMESLLASLGLVLAIMAAFLLHRRRKGAPAWLERSRRVFELGWLYRFGWRLYQRTISLGAFINHALEGQAGILWAILVLVLLLSLFLQLGLQGT